MVLEKNYIQIQFAVKLRRVFAVILASLFATNPYLDESRVLMDALQFEEALAKLNWARQSTANSVNERREIYTLMAKAHAAQGRLEEAERAFRELLVEDPSAPEPDEAPRIKKAFVAAKLGLYPKDSVRLEERQAPVGTVDLELFDPWKIAAQLIVSESNGGAFVKRVVPLVGGHGRTVLQPTDAQRIAWFAEVLDATSRTVASVGSPQEPRLFVRASQAQPATKVRRFNWPFWVLVGVSAAAVTVGSILAAQVPQTSAAAQRSDSAEETRALDAKAQREAGGAYASAGIAVLAAGAAVVLVLRW
jgi:pentatricopeptide repeat protein